MDLPDLTKLTDLELIKLYESKQPDDPDVDRIANGTGDNPAEFAKALSYTLDHLDGKSVVVVLPTPEYDFNVPDRAARLVLSGAGQLDDLRLSVAAYDQRNAIARAALLRAVQSRSIATVDPRDLFCRSERCLIVDGNGRPLFVDGVHLSRWGAELLAPKILDAVRHAERR